MMAIAHGKVDPSKVKGGRGVPPKSVADKYTDPGKDAPEQSGQNRGGSWTDEHHKKAKEKHEKSKKDVKKSSTDANELSKKEFDLGHELSKDKAAAVIVLDDNNRILMGKHKEGYAIPGGLMDDGDFGDYALTALRELKEEAGIIGHSPTKVWEGKDGKTNTQVFMVESWTGNPKHGDDLGPLKWFEVQDIKWDEVRPCCVKSLKAFIEQKLGKSLIGMLALENLEKNIIREKGGAVLEVTHGDALKLVGTGLFRRLREAVNGMKDEDFKDIKFDTYNVSIRRHMSDVYSGRVVDGHKVIYQFTNKSLPELTAALMSVFEWYLPEDEKDLDMLSDDISDDDIHGGLNNLIENYKKHNIGNIYSEMETIREQIRNGVAVDIQQVEARIMSLFDKLEDVVRDMSSKHNDLASMAGKEIDELDKKLRELQSKLDEIGKMPNTVEAYSARKINTDKVHDENYPYLPRPQIEIEPNGKMKITFASEWSDLEKQDFLHDLKARVVTKKKK